MATKTVFDITTGVASVVPLTQAEIDAMSSVPVQPVVMSVTRAQALLAMDEAGVLDAVLSWVASSSRAVQIEFQNRQTFESTYPLIEQARDALGWTDDDVLGLFAIAATK